MRRSLLGESRLDSPLASWGHGELALALTASTAVLVGLAVMTFRWGVRRA